MTVAMFETNGIYTKYIKDHFRLYYSAFYFINISSSRIDRSRKTVLFNIIKMF